MCHSLEKWQAGFSLLFVWFLANFTIRYWGWKGELSQIHLQEETVTSKENHPATEASHFGKVKLSGFISWLFLTPILLCCNWHMSFQELLNITIKKGQTKNNYCQSLRNHFPLPFWNIKDFHALKTLGHWMVNPQSLPQGLRRIQLWRREGKNPTTFCLGWSSHFYPKQNKILSLNLRSQALHGPYSTARMRLSVDFYAPKSYMQNQKKKTPNTVTVTFNISSNNLQQNVAPTLGRFLLSL